MGDSTSKKKTKPDEGPSFEVALARLEAIVEKLDDGNLPLAQALSLYKEGNALAKRCRTLLTEAEVEVKEALAADKAELV
ncbi:MAG TPA: exodeoxyribonuclease VII small subunit [Candidatus Eremiobacteraceae bacterium]|nr:exodeoxyribonuclease VII small subunit [Candidatus Eremiobacteraceae bacterium]